MDKKLLFLNDLKTRALFRNVDIYEDMDQKRFFFQNDIKKCRFRRNVAIFGYNNDFSKWSQNNVISSKYWYFFKRSTEKYLFVEFWYFRRYGLKTIFQSDLKKTSFSLNIDIYVDLEYSELEGQSKALTCYGSWKYEKSINVQRDLLIIVDSEHLHDLQI